MTGRAIGVAATLVAATACESGPVQWQEQRAVSERGNATSLRLALDDGGGVSFVSASAPQSPPDGAMSACPGSLRFARIDGGGFYAVWWQPRSDLSADLVASYSQDGGTQWTAPVPVDTLDRETLGCDRPPPAIAASGDYVHVAYSLRAPEGTGVFFAHSMDRAGLFHAPVPIVYGDRLTQASVAAEGDRVAVAYVDPNSRPAHVGLALSRTMGHLFEARTTASTGVGAASSPRVALRGDRVAVSWIEGGSGGRTAPGGTRMTRVGRLQ